MSKLRLPQAAVLGALTLAFLCSFVADGRADSNAVGRVSGTVVDSGGQPMPGLKLRFKNERDPGARAIEASTNKKGKFSVGFFPAGYWRPEIVSDTGDLYVAKLDYTSRGGAANPEGDSPDSKDAYVSGQSSVAGERSGTMLDPNRSERHTGQATFAIASGASVELALTIGKGTPVKGNAVAPEGTSPLTHANELLRSGDYDGVLAITERVLAAEPESVPALYMRASALLQRNRGAEARPLLRKLLALPSPPAGTRAMLGSILLDDAAALEGDAAHKAEATPLYGEAADLLLADAPNLPNPTLALTNAVIALEKVGRKDEARDTMNKLLERDPNNVRLRLRYADTMLAAGKKAEALASLRAIDLTPLAVSEKLAVAEMLDKCGAREDALKLLESVPIDTRDAAAVLYNVAVGMINAGRNDAAITLLERCAKGQPSLAFVHRTLGYSYLSAGRMSDAVAELSRALELDPNAKDAAADRAVIEKLKKP